jgi:hypothetical protein
VQIKTRVVGVLAATAAAAAMMGAPAFAQSGPVNVGNVIGNGNVSTDSGNYTYAPTTDPSETCGIALAFLGFADASCQGGAEVDNISYDHHDHHHWDF